MEFSEGDRHGTASNMRDPVEDSQEDSEEEEASDTVRRVNEAVDGVSDEDIKSVMEMIKNAKETDNSAQGLISSNTDFRSSNLEAFLFDSGASVSIIGGKNGSGKQAYN